MFAIEFCNVYPKTGDVWVFDLITHEWEMLDCDGPAPLPRSLHTAVLIDNNMFVFGGWVATKPFGNQKALGWECTNSLAYLDIENVLHKKSYKLYMPFYCTYFLTDIFVYSLL